MPQPYRDRTVVVAVNPTELIPKSMAKVSINLVCAWDLAFILSWQRKDPNDEYDIRFLRSKSFDPIENHAFAGETALQPFVDTMQQITHREGEFESLKAY